MAIALFVASGVAGVGSDFVRIPQPKKIALTVAAVASVLVVLRGRRTAPTWYRVISVLWVIFALLMCNSLWFWN